MNLAKEMLKRVLPRDELAVQSGWRQKTEDAMANKAERPKMSRQIDRVMRNLTVGGVIASGAMLWGYAVYNVVMRTL